MMQRAGLAVMLAFAAGRVATAAPDKGEPVVRAFLDRHCVSCHGPERAKSGFRVDQLPSDFSAPKAADRWKEVMDMINLGKMPPKKKPRPKPPEFEPVIDWINTRLREEELAAKNAGGRIPMRRLNRTEFANTVRDLLHLDPKVLAPIVEDLPGDGKAEGFDRLGVALFFDQTQIVRTLGVAERIAERAIVEGKPEVHSTRRKAEDDVRVKGGLKRKTTKGFAGGQVAVGPTGYRPVNGGIEYVQGYASRKDPSWGRVMSVDCGPVVVEDGYYRIKVRAGADPGSRGTPIRIMAEYGTDTPVETRAELAVDAPLDAPGEFETTVFLRRGPEDLKRRMTLSFNQLPKLIVSTPEYNALRSEIVGGANTYQKRLAAGAPKAELDAITRKLEEAKARGRAWKGPARHFNPELDSKNAPTLYLDWVEVSGPVRPEWPPKSHRTLLFDGAREDPAYVREVFTRFLPRAYRRPVSRAEIDGVVDLVARVRAKGGSFIEAIRLGLARLLCSPGFLFIQEPTGEELKPRPLNDHELASRLSYFLWSTMPDKELRALADSGRLRDPKELLRQVDRMVDDPKSEAFVRGFAGQWLQVRDFGTVMPAREYRDYDAALEEASKEEAYAFFREVMRKDLPVSSFLDSDFLVINERLARHYGIEGVKGPEFRRVAIRPEHHRGGVLGMSGLLTLLADGTRTLPVRRAAWVKTELFDDPPGNPPPNAGEIQPNTAGKNLTVRERLERHRNEPTCASCHARLDAFGIALENYDAIGKWRTRANGEGFRGKNAPPIDIRGAFPDGTPFATLEEYKAGLLRRREAFARALTKKVMTYGLTRPVGYADHETVGDVLNALKRNDYRFRTLIRTVVTSDLFRTK